jgi:hypothetical protein
MTEEVSARIHDLAPDRIVLLPLYPQFSTTTTASSRQAWLKSAERRGIAVPTRTVCCYPTDPGFIAAVADLTRPVYERARAAFPAKPPRLLFTAHGLPKKIVAGGDPYQTQIEMTAAAVVAALAIPGLDWQISYQSRVGPLEWSSSRSPLFPSIRKPWSNSTSHTAMKPRRRACRSMNAFRLLAHTQNLSPAWSDWCGQFLINRRPSFPMAVSDYARWRQRAAP